MIAKYLKLNSYAKFYYSFCAKIFLFADVKAKAEILDNLRSGVKTTLQNTQVKLE